MPWLQPLAKVVFRFATISGLGLAIDFGLFYLLLLAGTPPALANLASAGVAVTYVYFTSVSKVFSYRGSFLLPLFLAYLCYQAVAVSLASVAVGALAVYFNSPTFAKLVILPITFAANFVCMFLLTRQRSVQAKVGP